MIEEQARDDQQARTASPKEKFTLLFEMLKFYYSSPLDGLVRTSAILLVVAGWMASSDAVQRQLDLNPWLRWWGLTLIAVGEGLYLYISWRVYLRSKITSRLLDELAYMETKYYANYRIPGRVMAAYCVASILIAASAGTLVFMIQAKPSTGMSSRTAPVASRLNQTRQAPPSRCERVRIAGVVEESNRQSLGPNPWAASNCSPDSRSLDSVDRPNTPDAKPRHTP